MGGEVSKDLFNCRIESGIRLEKKLVMVAVSEGLEYQILRKNQNSYSGLHNQSCMEVSASVGWYL